MTHKMTRDDRLRVVNDVAQNAISEFAKGPLVLLAPRDIKGRPLDHGSGTLVRSDRGCVVLTCAHVIRILGNQLTLGHTANRFVDDALGPAVYYPRVDIAVAPVRDPAPFLEFAISIDQIADAEAFPLPKDDPLLAIGFPEHLSHEVSLVRDERIQPDVMRRGYAHIAHLTSLAGEDNRALSIHWDKAEISDETAAKHPLGVTPGVKNLRKPSGVSGGAVWWFGSFATNSVLWTPRRAGRLVAVPYQFTGGRAQAIPARVWRAWLQHQLAAH